ncbi:MAG: hypothetical protein M1834_006025 [Cirrosporium novae-zelandiae]|nr:MAG: hypothetical protein M1834_006025 [Cirrosporium novae-zelandiae]
MSIVTKLDEYAARARIFKIRSRGRGYKNKTCLITMQLSRISSKAQRQKQEYHKPKAQQQHSDTPIPRPQSPRPHSAVQSSGGYQNPTAIAANATVHPDGSHGIHAGHDPHIPRFPGKQRARTKKEPHAAGKDVLVWQCKKIRGCQF